VEDHALVAHLLDASVDDRLLELEVGNAVHEEAADAVGALEDLDRVPRAVQLRGRREPGRPEPTTATRFPVRREGGVGTIQPSLNA
jgi:hypothetical protein